MEHETGRKALATLLRLGEKTRLALWEGWQWGRENVVKTTRILQATPTATPQDDGGASHLDLARQSLRKLLQDKLIPDAIRHTLADEFQEMEQLLQRLEQQEIHLVACGRVSVGKSALLNALLGREAFSVSPLHGETRQVNKVSWQEATTAGIMLIDTPGIDEPGGEEREELARRAAARGDLILFVIDGDMTDSEFRALQALTAINRPLLVVLNKADRYTREELAQLQSALHSRLQGLSSPDHLVVCAAKPGEKIYVAVDERGVEREIRRRPDPDIAPLRDLLWNILEAEGKTLAAVNASLFASQVSDQVAERIVQIKKEVADQVIHAYCLWKGVATAFNPVPLVDLFAVAADAALVAHLGRIYGLPITLSEAGGLIRVIAGQLTLLMGTVWGTQLLSSALKGLSGGLSTLVTGGAQGAIAYYGALVVGRAAERYFAQGRSWGPDGPKQAIKEILDSLDRQSILLRGRDEILARIRA